MGNHTTNRYAVQKRWELSREYKLPFDYIIGEGPSESEEASDAAEEVGKQVVQIHRLDMGDLIKLGIAEELDFMSKALIADDKKISDEKAREAVDRAIMKADNFNRMEKMVNLVVQAGVLQPSLFIPPRDEKARQKGLIYVDWLPWNDRLELFSEIFETEGLSTFREKQESGVGNVEHESGVPLPADGSVDVRPDDTEGVLLQ
jgi:hypothetical protein